MVRKCLRCSNMREVPAEAALLIGKRIRELRMSGGVTVVQLADTANAQGMKWSYSRISALERGKVALGPGVLYVVAGVLSSLLDRDVTVADLVPEDEPIRLTPDLVVAGSQLAGAFRGEAVKLPARGVDLDDLVWAAEESERQKSVPNRGWSDEDEAGAWKSLTILTRHLESLSKADHLVLNAVTPDDHLAGLIAALQLWGATPLVERDRRAPDGANAQKLGRITRELITELTEATEGGQA